MKIAAHIVCILALLVGCASQSFAELPTLDVPFRVTDHDDAFRQSQEVRKKLAPEDQGPFSEGFTYFAVHFDRHISAELTAQERDFAFVTALNGLTPRQVIIIGMIFRLELLRQPDPDAGSRSEKEAEHLRTHVRGQETATIWAIRHYGKKG